jgi:two-component system sensor histidine kinase MprB
VTKPWATLRGRLALLSAAAVALAVTAACVSAYFLVRNNLLDAIDASLRSSPFGRSTATAPAQPPHSSTTTPRGLQFDVQALGPTGTVISTIGPARIAVTPADVARARSPGRDVLYDTTDNDGTHVRVLVRHRSSGGAVMIARPLTESDQTLDQLLWVLLAVTGVGVLGAAGLGLVVARAGIRPVDRLTEAAERIARTGQADPPLSVRGTDELARLGSAFNEMVMALAASRDRQRHLVLDAGHELRTPVTVLQTNIELLRRAEAHPERMPADERRELLADLDAQAHELATLVGDIIELSRGSGHERGSQVVLAVRDPLQRAVERARLRAAPTVTFDVQLDDTTIVGDPPVLERAFVNLLDNALKFGPPSQVVTVRLDRAVCSVSDEGGGISTGDLPHVLDRFYRAASSRQLPGSGLGLAIVAAAAAEHEASVGITGGVTHGTTVTLDFTARAVDPTGHPLLATPSRDAVPTASRRRGL